MKFFGYVCIWLLFKMVNVIYFMFVNIKVIKCNIKWIFFYVYLYVYICLEILIERNNMGVLVNLFIKIGYKVNYYEIIYMNVNNI